MEENVITLAVARGAQRGTSRREPRILGHIPLPRRAIYVNERGSETLIVSVDQETIMATGRDLYEAAGELAEIQGLPVRLLDHKGREMWCVSAAPELIS